MFVFYFFAALVIWLGILSLRGGLSFAAYLRRETARPIPDFTPFVSVIAPSRGLEEGLRENISALFEQNYPGYEIIFVTGRADDPSLAVVNRHHTRHALPNLESSGRRTPCSSSSVASA